MMPKRAVEAADAARAASAGEAGAFRQRARRCGGAQQAGAGRGASYVYQDAAARAGRRSAEAVSKLVARFNSEGLAALEPHGRGGPKPTYDARARQRVRPKPGARPIQRKMERKRSGNPSFARTLKLRTLRFGITRRGEHESTADGALPSLNISRSSTN